MRPIRWSFILVAVALVSSVTVPVAVVVFTTSPLSSPGGPIAHVVVSVATNKPTYGPGEPMLIAVRATNAGDGVAVVSFESTCQASYSILAKDGSTVYDYQVHVACDQISTNLTLRPGESHLSSFAWTQTTDSGVRVLPATSFWVQGVLLSTKPIWSPLAEVTILGSSGGSEPNLAFSARTDRATYAPGDSVKVTVVLTNIGSQTVLMHFGSPCYVQFVVLDRTRQAVYNSSKWSACIQVLTDVTLAPRESRSFLFSWDLTTDSGKPIVAGHEYSVVPSFAWGTPMEYQRYVSRTDVATFTLAAFTV
ncbi:MAG: BsuPI-related putative proteinase inhibitor [Thermoplasmata archaeon]|nr:BsuPI-related putative proteinase inhibitor [Thermoplasmata archaeon]